MNQFGAAFRVNIFGESHGPAVGITIDGCPAGLSLSVADFEIDMERRRGGSRPGTTPRKEDDIPVFLSGIFNDKTTGAPLTIIFENKNTRSADYEKQRDTPRPGHADLTASQKFGGYEDYRGGGHFSGRLTACLVGAGIIAKKILAFASENITCNATLIEAGGETDIEKGIQKAIAAGDSIGGIVECITDGLPAGLGEPFFNSAESLIAHAVFAIPAIKGIEFGAGFSAAKMFGSQHNDAIENASGKTATNNAGGISGGISNGNSLVFRIAVKPASSTPKEQQTYNKASGEVEAFSVKGRHDLCIALRVPVVAEAVTVMVLVDLMISEQRIKRVIRP
jgi:chorismate synthase